MIISDNVLNTSQKEEGDRFQNSIINLFIFSIKCKNICNCNYTNKMEQNPHTPKTNIIINQQSIIIPYFQLIVCNL